MGTRWEVQAILLGVVSLPFVFGRCAGVLWGMSALGWIKPLQNPTQSNDYVAALGAVEGYYLTTRWSAATYRAASVDQDK